MSTYGLEIWDKNGDKTLSLTDRITRLLYTTEVAAGTTSSYTITDGMINFRDYYANTSITSDDFNDGINTDIWTIDEATGITIDEQNGKLKFNATTSNSGTATLSQENISGNFEVSIKVVDSNNTNAQLGFIFSDGIDYPFPFIKAYDTGGTLYLGLFDGASPRVDTSITTPSYPYWIKFKRSGSTGTIYTSTNGTSWTQRLQDDVITTTQDLIIYYNGQTSNESYVYFDDFVNIKCFYTTPTLTMFGYGYALESNKIAHQVEVEQSGDDILIEWTAKSLSVYNAANIDSSKSLIVAMVY